MVIKAKTRVSAYPQFLSNYAPETLVAGVDEVGRGALFGPVVAAAVVFSKAELQALDEYIQRDSKALSAKQREKLAEIIKDNCVAYGVGSSNPEEIDQINILQASLQAMKRALINLPTQPDLVLVDGQYKVPDIKIEQLNFTKGDERFSLIAAASIIAKVDRDRTITEFSSQYPEYDLHKNKGYGTSKHIQALCQYGSTPLHRRSFSPCQISPNMVRL